MSMPTNLLGLVDTHHEFMSYFAHRYRMITIPAPSIGEEVINETATHKPITNCN